MATDLSSPRDEILVNPQDPVPINNSKCNVCQKPAAFMCSSCGLNGPRYCSTECQAQGWREGHYRLCQGNAEAREHAVRRTQQQAEPAQGQSTTNSEFGEPLSTVQTKQSGIGRFGAAQIINSRRKENQTHQRSVTQP